MKREPLPVMMSPTIGRSTALIELLPLDAWMVIVDYLHDDDDASSLQSLSETSYAVNLACAQYLRQTLMYALDSSLPRQASESSFERSSPLRKGCGVAILRRLLGQDSEAAHILVNQYTCTIGPDDSDEGVLRPQTTVPAHPSSILLGNKARTATTRLQERLVVTAQHANLRLRQLSDEFSARLLAQKERLLFWTRTAMGCILVVVMMTTSLTAGENKNPNSTTYIPAVAMDGTEATTSDSDWMVTRLLLGGLFSVIVALGVARSQRPTSSPPSPTRTDSNGSHATLKRSQSVAGDFFATRAPLLEERSTRTLIKRTDSGIVPPTTRLLGSASTPNLHGFLLAHQADAADSESIEPCLSLWPDDHDNGDESVYTDPLLTIPTTGGPAELPVISAAPISCFPSLAAVRMPTRLEPHGCVGIYHHVLALAKCQVIEHVKEQRQRAFETMSAAERHDLSTAFLDACTNDDSLDIVRDMCNSLPVDAFFVGADGTESCALHTAAFHGATKILHFLCRGISVVTLFRDSGSLLYNDGGLCQVDATDANGWTALHFSASAGNVEAVRILVLQHGADPNVQAINGYTPWQWAQRLQNVTVANELRRLTLLVADTKQKKRRLQFLQRARQHGGSILLLTALLLIPNFALVWGVVPLS
jgi:Ankyrin repeats (many copies)